MSFPYRNHDTGGEGLGHPYPLVSFCAPTGGWFFARPGRPARNGKPTPMSGVLLAPLRSKCKCAKGPVPMAKKLFAGSPIGLHAMAARRRLPSANGGRPERPVDRAAGVPSP
jgi:hypothetical protein